MRARHVLKGPSEKDTTKKGPRSTEADCARQLCARCTSPKPSDFFFLFPPRSPFAGFFVHLVPYLPFNPALLDSADGIGIYWRTELRPSRAIST